MFCNFCGAQLPDGTKFCNICGKTLAPTQQPEQQFSPQQPQPPFQQPAFNPQQAPVGYPQPPMGYPQPVTPVMTQPKKKSKAKIVFAVIFIILAAIVVISLIVNASKTVEHGTINGNVYTNESIGIKFTKPEEWNFLSDEELVEFNNGSISAEGFSDLASTLKEIESVYEMSAQSPLGNNIIVQLGYIPNSSSYSAEDFLNEFADQLESESLLTDYNIGKITKREIAGEQFSTLDATTVKSYVTAHQRVCARKHGNYIVIFIMTAFSQEDLEAIENMITVP